MENNQFDYINVIPLVDIMLVLLTIVLTTSTLIATGSIPVSLPAAEAMDENHTVEVITISKDGSLHYKDKVISHSELTNALTSIDRSTPVIIRADRELILQQFVDILDVIKKMQFGKVSLQTDRTGS